ncbi:hypothetical protein A3K73_02130 [Candidatus Pacearchaeota archaeon RBG_13_36_9]|nr:MAG: hypothetical protein A3K73_02130 [Candidatus Pacearchaeota archaeon RBG_13_36_9]
MSGLDRLNGINLKIDLEATKLTQIRSKLKWMYIYFSDGSFLPNRAHDVFERQELLKDTRAHLESGYKQFEKGSVYRSCIRYLDLLEEIVYRYNPEGGLN